MAELATDWKVWLHGLGATVIGGVANAILVYFVAPEIDWNHLVQIAGGSGVLAAAGYLKQSPLPKIGGSK